MLLQMFNGGPWPLGGPRFLLEGVPQSLVPGPYPPPPPARIEVPPSPIRTGTGLMCGAGGMPLA